MDQRKKLCAPAAYVGTVGQVSHFLGIKFTWKFHSDGNLSVSLTQQSFIDTLLASLDICIYGISTYSTPYQPNFHSLRLRYQSLVGSLNWVAHTTRLDLSTVVSLLEHLLWSPYCIFLFLNLYYQCPMQIGTHRMLHNLQSLRSYHCLFLVQCPLFILISQVLSTVYPSIRQLLRAVLWRQRSTPRKNM